MKPLSTTVVHPAACVLASMLALAAALPASAQSAAGDWQRCRAIVAAAERLACYDALVDARSAPTTPAAATAPAAAPAPPAAPVAAAAATPAAAPAAPAPAPAATTAAQAAAEADFGLPASSRGPREITSTLPGFFPGWEPRARLRLANGQVWQVIDGSSAVLYLRDPVVKVQRGALGSFFLEIAGTNVSPRVRRVE